jgi:hypothetical protein
MRGVGQMNRGQRRAPTIERRSAPLVTSARAVIRARDERSVSTSRLCRFGRQPRNLAEPVPHDTILKWRVAPDNTRGM